jgi:surfactin synthase thioesterase subunit
VKDRVKGNAWLYNAAGGCANGRLRLVCFPPVGGSSSFFRTWLDAKLDGIEICAVQLPGREERFEERPFGRLRLLIEALVPFIPQDKPFAFFGHSMGALLAFELARELRRQGLPGPQGLFVSAAPAPQVPLRPARFSLPDHEFAEALRLLGGTAELILTDVDLLAYFMPVLRADFEVVDTYEYLAGEPLDCPIHVFGGENDLEVNHEGLRSWEVQTHGEFKLQIFPGEHFYLLGAWPELIAAICSDLRVSSYV